MNDRPVAIPTLVQAALAGARDYGFELSCDLRVGQLLATLAASKPGGRILEIGTGVGVGAAWLLSGMDPSATLTTIEASPRTAQIASRVLDQDRRCTMVVGDAAKWLDSHREPYDLVFVDCRPGKFLRRHELLVKLAPGGLYVADDLNPGPTWPVGHDKQVDAFCAEIIEHPELVVTLMDWASGLVVAARRTPQT